MKKSQYKILNCVLNLFITPFKVVKESNSIRVIIQMLILALINK